jgi:hypothetical protein
METKQENEAINATRYDVINTELTVLKLLLSDYNDARNSPFYSERWDEMLYPHFDHCSRFEWEKMSDDDLKKYFDIHNTVCSGLCYAVSNLKVDEFLNKPSYIVDLCPFLVGTYGITTWEYRWDSAKLTPRIQALNYAVKRLTNELAKLQQNA